MKIILIEDEPLVAQRLERFCREILAGQLEKLHVVTSLAAAEGWLAENPVDIALLDLNLENQDGMGLLQRSVASAFHTIIVSANTDRALEAFQYGVIDFVPKPFTRERLARPSAGDRVRRPSRICRPDAGREKNPGASNLCPSRTCFLCRGPATIRIGADERTPGVA